MDILLLFSEAVQDQTFKLRTSSSVLFHFHLSENLVLALFVKDETWYFFPHPREHVAFRILKNRKKPICSYPIQASKDSRWCIVIYVLSEFQRLGSCFGRKGEAIANVLWCELWPCCCIKVSNIGLIYWKLEQFIDLSMCLDFSGTFTT